MQNHHNITGQPVPASSRTIPVECPLCNDTVIEPGVLVCEECYNGPTEDDA